MRKNLQVRRVPDDVHRTLKARAARAGLTLSDYLLGEITEIANRPTLEELFERIRRRTPPRGRINSAAAVRAERDGRR